MEVLIFEVGPQHYGLPARQTVEVLRAGTITSLPKAPSIVEGAIDIRGTIVPVLDFRSRFRLAPKPLSVSDQFVVAQAGTRKVAIRADRATRLAQVSDSDLRALSNLGGQREYIAGIATLADGMVIIHDLETFLTEAESLSLEQSLEEWTRD